MTDLQGHISDPRGTLSVLGGAFAFLIYGSLVFGIDGAAILARPAGFPALTVVHAFAGFIVLSIVAAAHQLIPVVTGSRTQPAWVAVVLAAPIALGFALLVASFDGMGLFIPAGIVLTIGITAWTLATLVRLFSGKRELRTRIALGLAIVAFLAAASIGMMMALAFGGLAPGEWLRLAPAHALLAIIGFVSVVIVSVSYRLVPMFALSHTRDGLARFAPALATAPLSALAAASLFAPAWIFRAVIVAVVAAMITFVAVQADALRHRLRRKLDVSLRYAIVTWSFGLLATAAVLAASYAPRFAPVAVVLALLGWITPAILGYAYKIVGFLAWQSARDRFPEAQLPPLSGAVDLRLAGVALFALATGALGSAIAAAGPTLLGIPPAVYCAGVLLSLVALAQTVNRYRRTSCKESLTVAAFIHRSRWSESSLKSTP